MQSLTDLDDQDIFFLSDWKYPACIVGKSKFADVKDLNFHFWGPFFAQLQHASTKDVSKSLTMPFFFAENPMIRPSLKS